MYELPGIENVAKVVIDEGVIDGETKVRDAIKNAEKDVGAPIKLTKFVRYALGEGIEKVETDFAAEVAATSGVPQQPTPQA